MLGFQTIYPQQCQAARALLGWSQVKLAERAGVPRSALARFESGEDIDVASMLAIKRVLEEADIEFLTRADGASGIKLASKRNRTPDPIGLA
jgi:transcriptional regulator with XRE-family HTH domain